MDFPELLKYLIVETNEKIRFDLKNKNGRAWMSASSKIERVRRCWTRYKLISGKAPSLLSSHYRHKKTSARHFKALGGEQSLSELVVSFWLIPSAENVLNVNSCFRGFDQFWPHPSIAQAKLSRLTEILATLSPNQEHSLSINLSDSTERHDRQLYLLDASRFLISWSFLTSETHIKGFKLFKEGGEYGILSSCDLIQARRRQKKGIKPDKWSDIQT